MRAYSDREIREAVHAYMFGSDHPDVVGYRTQSLERDLASFDLYMWGMKRLQRLGSLTNKRVLDVGCGIGWQALTVAMLGNNHVVASDILPSMIAGASECLASIKAAGIEVDLTPLRGDICDLDLPDGSFDAIYSMEAVEHVRDLDAMSDSFARLLRTGGKAIIVNDCNVLHRGTRSEIEHMWRKREEDWDWSNYLRSIRPIEHGDARPFRLMREEIVSASAPHLAPSERVKVVEATAGMVKADIEELAKSYTPGDQLPRPHDLDWCRNPLTGEYAERLLDPFAMADGLRQRGFKVQVRHGFRRQPLRLLNGIQLRPLNIALFNVRPLFFIVAKKIS